MATNRLLAELPGEQRQALLRTATTVSVAQGATLYDVGQEITWVYFPLSSLVSVVSTTRDGHTLELASVGRDGMVAIETVLHAPSAQCRVVVQFSGEMLRIRADELQALAERNAITRRVLLQYASHILEQTSRTAMCHRFHTIIQRLARWLLVTRDRLDSDVIHLSEERIGHLLGSPRTGVTRANVRLQDLGAIRQRRGRTFIVSPKHLREAACECYRPAANETVRFTPASALAGSNIKR